ncbi:MAG: DUF2254 family protein [Candidatus Nanopelagicales bacterium]
MDDLTTGLALMAARERPPSERCDESGQLRVVAPAVSLSELLGTQFADLRQYAIDSPGVLSRCLVLAEKVGDRACDPKVRDCLVREVREVVDAYALPGPRTADLARLSFEAESVIAGLSYGSLS